MSNPLPQFQPSNWYWIVAGSAVQVFSSVGAAYVPVADATYVAWLAKGNRATRIASEAELWDVLAAQYPAGLPAAVVAAQDARKAMIVNAADRALIKVCFDLVNRVRALESKPAVTQAQFLAYVKSLIP